MKRSITLIIFSIYLFANSQSVVTWSTPVTVATTSYGNLHPRVQTDASGSPLILWGQSNYVEYFSRLTGGNFTTPVRLNPMAIPVFTASWAGPDMAAKGDTIYTVFKHTPEDTNHIYVVRSFDGGMTFSIPVRVDYIADSISRFPAIAIDDNGQPVVAFMKFDAGFMNARYVVCRSNNYGSSFTADVLASGMSGGKVCDCCPAEVVSSGNTVAMVYRANQSDIRDTWAGISTNSGTSFTSGVEMDSTNWYITSCPASGPDGVIIGDSIYTVFMSGASGQNRAYFNKASISSLQVGRYSRLTGNLSGLTDQNYPRIASWDTSAAAVWKQTINGNDMISLLFTKNIHRGFGSRYDTIAIGGVVNADVAISRGKVHVVWEDDNAGTVMYMEGAFTVDTSSITTGINYPAIANAKMTVFPNPAGKSVHVELPASWNNEIVEVKVTDVLGKEIINFRNEYNSGLDISLDNLNTGIYFVRVSHNAEQLTTRLLKE